MKTVRSTTQAVQFRVVNRQLARIGLSNAMQQCKISTFRLVSSLQIGGNGQFHVISKSETIVKINT